MASVAGPLADYAPGFAKSLVERGYSKSAAKKQMQLLAHVDRWLDAEGRGVDELTVELVEPLFAARRSEGRSNLLTTKAMKPLIGFLRRSGVPEPAAEPRTDPVERIVDRYRLHLERERGLVEGTIHFYAHVARLFLSEQPAPDGDGFAGITPAGVIEFTGRICEGRGLSSARQSVSGLRSLLRWMQMEGMTGAHLEQAVWSVAGWSPNLPRAVDAAQAQLLLNGCDRRRTLERRDYAILVLLVRLGLRGGEVVGLELDDIDWRRG
jgi:site-specific recombinase XerD